MCVIKNKRNYKGPGTYVGRPSVLGNPFSVEQYGRGVCIPMYRVWLWEQIQKGNAAVLAELRKINDDTVLICWCVPQPCHAEVIAAAAKWLRKEDQRKAAKAAVFASFVAEDDGLGF